MAIFNRCSSESHFIQKKASLGSLIHILVLFIFAFNTIFRDNKVIDYRGRVVNHYPAIPTILKFLSENNIKISVASRNAVTEGAKKLLNLFGWNKYFQSIQIYVGKKTNHIMR